MALLGFELLFISVREQLRSNDDAAIAAVHWKLVANGLKCCGAGDTWPDSQSESHRGSEALPSGWNQDSSIYTLRYVDPTSNRTYLMKALAMDGSLILHLVRCFDEKAVSTTIRSRDFVTDNHESVESTFRGLSILNNQLDKELYQKLLGGGATGGARTSASDTTASTSTRQPAHHDPPERSPLMVGPPRGPGGGVGYIPPRNPFGPGSQDPFNIGGADLDPFGRGGGGMFMDPRALPGRGGFLPGAQPLPGFPPGSVPPGARFDPVGPPGMRPQPDPDHERPPDDYDNMFM